MKKNFYPVKIRIIMEAEGGNIERLATIIETENPKKSDVLYGLLAAIENNHFPMFQYLMPLADLTNTEPLQRAAAFERHDMFDVLYPLCDARKAYDEFMKKWSNSHGGAEIFEQRFQSEKEHALLEATQQQAHHMSTKKQKI